jgi:hypothetical protein
MKKFAALVAVLALVAFAAPAFAANPFMDVPMNHWAYDAVSQLASRGVVSGYPDGAFKGEWKATRYEMASVVARALAYVDMNKASKQDLELLKKLVVEFKDELDALSVKVDELDSRVALPEDRIGGWQFGGYYRVYMNFNDDDDEWSVNRFRWNIKKYVDDKVTLNVRLQGGGGDDLKIELAYLTIKMPWDVTATVGRFWNDWEGDFYAGDWWYFNMNDAYITDYRADTAVLFNKAFAMGNFSLYVAHEENKGGAMEAFGPYWYEYPVYDSGGSDIIGYYMNEQFVGGYLASDRYIYGARLNFNFNEMFSMAVNYMKYDYKDDTQVVLWENEYFRPYSIGDYTLYNTNVYSLFTIAADTQTLWADIIVNFTPGIALKAQYFMQENDDTWAATNWISGGPGEDSPNAWKAILTVDQDTLGFTSLWLEYAQLDAGFVFPNGVDPYGWFSYTGNYLNEFAQVVTDTTVLNVLAMQKWNDKWGTYVRYLKVDTDYDDYDNWTAAVTYWYTPNLAFELGYDKLGGDLDDDTVFLRTVVFF